MKYFFLFLTLIILSATSYSQNCQHGQCRQIKSDGEQCKRCVGYLESYCSSHKTPNYNLPLNTLQTPSSPNYNENNKPDCKHSQCSAYKQDGTRCKRCTGNQFELYCSSHKINK